MIGVVFLCRLRLHILKIRIGGPTETFLFQNHGTTINTHKQFSPFFRRCSDVPTIADLMDSALYKLAFHKNLLLQPL